MLHEQRASADTDVHALAVERDQRTLAEVQQAITPIVSSPVMVTVNDDTVTVAGDAASEAERASLLAAVREVAGVEHVVDRLALATPEPAAPSDAPELPPEPDDTLAELDGPGEELDELPLPEEPDPGSGDELAMLDEPTEDRLPAEPTSNAEPAALTLSMRDRALLLDGRIGDDDDPTVLIEPALAALDPSYLTNRMITDPDTAPADWLERVASLLPNMAELTDPSIDIVGRQITLAGTAPTRQSHDALIDAALEAFGDYALVERIDVARLPPESASPGDADVPPNELAPQPLAAANAPVDDAASLREALDALGAGRLSFESGSDRLTPDSAARLDELAALFARVPDVAIEIEGHTDASGSTEANLTLSQQRATAVRNALIERDVAADRLVAYGYGEGVPLADNATPEGRARNRRIEFRFQ